MLKRLLLGVSAGIVAFSLAIGLMLFLGSTQKSPARDFGLSDQCAQPCWNGIVLGQSTYDDVRQRLRQSGYTIISDTTYDSRKYNYISPEITWFNDKLGLSGSIINDSVVEVASVDLYLTSHTLRIGDVMAVLGLPTSYFICISDEPTNMLHKVLYYNYGDRNSLFVESDSDFVSYNVDQAFDPNLAVQKINYSDMTYPAFSIWQGFHSHFDNLGC